MEVNTFQLYLNSSFAKGERPDGRNDSPGPGTYDLSDPRVSCLFINL